MTCLLLNTEADLSDPRVAVLDNRARAAGFMCSTPTRLGWVVTEPRDLLRRPDFAPEIAQGVHLGNGDLVRIFREFDPTATVKRFADRAAGATRTAKMLLGRFTTTQGESEAMEESAQTQEHPSGSNPFEEGVVATKFNPAVGTRVTLLADEARGIPEEHGVVTKVEGDEYTVTVDPLYRGVNDDGEGDDGERIVELVDMAPDPVGTAREAAERVDPKAAKAAEKEAAKQAKATERAAKREARLAEKAVKAEPARQPKATQARQRTGKQPVPAAEFKPLRPGTIRERIVTRMDGTRTSAQIAEEVGLTKSNTSSHIFCLWRDGGLGFEYDAEGRVRVLPPHGMKVSDLFKGPEAAA